MTRNKGLDTLLLEGPINSVSVLKLQLWEETETASELQSHGGTRSMDQLLQEYENSAYPLQKDKSESVIPREN